MATDANSIGSLREMSVLMVPGIGPERALRLERLGIRSVRDLLLYFPYRYDSLSQSDDLSALHGSAVTVVGVVRGPVSVRYRSGRSVLTVTVVLEGEREQSLQAVFFNQPYLRHQLQDGKILQLTGKYDAHRSSLTVSSYSLKVERTASEQPVYRVNSQISVHTLRTYIGKAIELFGHRLEDELPLVLRERFRLVSYANAILSIHFPKDAQALRQARRRLVFEEFLRFQLAVQGFRHIRAKEVRPRLDLGALAGGVAAFTARLPFTLTGAQAQAIEEISSDVCDVHPMHRLLQGDVGSGKTAVAFALAAGLAGLGWQTALMAPTGILALQHRQDAARWLTPHGVRVADLTSRMPAKTRRETIDAIAHGDVDVVIGTHALVSEQVTFQRLRLVITDEQHRFGVGVRRLLREKGRDVDVLQLSATPIPRTLALTLYGDVAITSMRERPAGRQPIETLWVRPKAQEQAFRLLRRELTKGHQVFVVAARIDPSDDGPGFSAVELYDLCQDELANWQVGILHGQMPEAERERVMDAFVRGEVQVLVATTIVEVGVSVANATAIVIFEADRFGVATLHQLRGRVGRSEFPSYCVLVSDLPTIAAKSRIHALRESQDGFSLAEQDLILRGPGEAFGDRQSGLPVFAIGDVIADRRVMEVARDVARELLQGVDFWILPSFSSLRQIAIEQVDEHADS
ncbi:MAG: ATP-dependent DNA helicase RecG [Firmicutes bacterium]|nr:ATP-dependent DNA helicase RecG [Bacillota bacterium]